MTRCSKDFSSGPLSLYRQLLSKASKGKPPCVGGIAENNLTGN